MPRWSTSPPAATTPLGMTSRRSTMADAAHDQYELRAGVEGAADGRRDGAGIVAATDFVHDPAMNRFEAGPKHAGGLVQHRVLRGRQPGLDDGRGGRPEGRDPNRRLRAETFQGAIKHLAGDRERNDLDRGEHLVGAHRPPPGQSGDGQRLVHGVEPIDLRLGDQAHTIGFREHVAAPGKRRADAGPGACEAPSPRSRPRRLRSRRPRRSGLRRLLRSPPDPALRRPCRSARGPS